MAKGKHAKKVTRREKVAAKKRRARVITKQRRFPKFVLQAGDAPPEFVERVRAATLAIDFSDRKLFPDKWERQYYHRMWQLGDERAIRYLKEEFPSDIEQRTALLRLHLGDLVLGQIPRDVLLTYIPFNDVTFVPERSQFRVVFRSLQKEKGPSGTIYFSQHRPTVSIDGKDYIIAFSRHAIERICERIGRLWPSYGSLGDVFAFLSQCLRFDVCALHGGHQAFTFFEDCSLGHWNYLLAETIVGDAFFRGLPYSLRAGYCPAVIDGEFFKAITLLYPGYAGTPEFGLIKSSTLPVAQKRSMINSTKELTSQAVLEDEKGWAVNLLKWFHDNGIPQVIQEQVPYASALAVPIAGTKNSH